MEIEMRGINKSFGNNAVLNNAGFVLSTGEIHALMGENGAGKSTLMKILTGVYTKDVGQVIVDGQEVCYKNAREAEKAGIVFIHQELNVLFDLTVEENMFLGKEIKKRGEYGMRMKRFVSVLAAAVMVFGVTGCNAITIDGETENVSGEAAGNGSIGFSVSTLNNPFFVTLSEGAKEKAKTEGEKLIVVDAGDDAAKQTSDIEDLISKNISVLIVNPVDSDAVAPAVKDAVSRGIKVISVDRGVNGVDVDCAIASDNVEGAKMATEYMVSLLGENAKVAELEGVSGASATIERGKGFHLVADKKLNVVSKQTANFNRSEGMSVMENMLQANSAIQGVFAHNDEMALGAVEAVGNKKILVVGFDATDDAVAAVKAGKMAATVAQKPNLMGETAVETAIQILQGETVEKTIPVEVELITKESVK